MKNKFEVIQKKEYLGKDVKLTKTSDNIIYALQEVKNALPFTEHRYIGYLEFCISAISTQKIYDSD
jgi:hypothetical protein